MVRTLVLPSGGTVDVVRSEEIVDAEIIEEEGEERLETVVDAIEESQLWELWLHPIYHGVVRDLGLNPRIPGAVDAVVARALAEETGTLFVASS